MDRIPISRIAFLAVRVIAIYLGASSLVALASRLVYSTFDESWRISWRFILGEAAGLILAVIVWVAAARLADWIGRDGDRRFHQAAEPAVDDVSTAGTGTGHSFEDLLRIAFIIIGVLFVAWATEGLVRTLTSTVASDPSSQFGGPPRSWLELYRDNLAGNAVRLVIGLLLLFRGRLAAGALASRERTSSPGEEPPDGSSERVTFKFD